MAKVTPNKKAPIQNTNGIGRKPKAIFKQVRTDAEGNETTLTYGILPPRLSYKGKEYTATEIAENEALRNELLELAWEERDEAEFDSNGIFKIIY